MVFQPDESLPTAQLAGIGKFDLIFGLAYHDQTLRNVLIRPLLLQSATQRRRHPSFPSFSPTRGLLGLQMTTGVDVSIRLMPF